MAIRVRERAIQIASIHGPSPLKFGEALLDGIPEIAARVSQSPLFVTQRAVDGKGEPVEILQRESLAQEAETLRKLRLLLVGDLRGFGTFPKAFELGTEFADLVVDLLDLRFHVGEGGIGRIHSLLLRSNATVDFL